MGIVLTVRVQHDSILLAQQVKDVNKESIGGSYSTGDASLNLLASSFELADCFLCALLARTFFPTERNDQKDMWGDK